MLRWIMTVRLECVGPCGANRGNLRLELEGAQILTIYGGLWEVIVILYWLYGCTGCIYNGCIYCVARAGEVPFHCKYIFLMQEYMKMFGFISILQQCEAALRQKVPRLVWSKETLCSCIPIEAFHHRLSPFCI